MSYDDLVRNHHDFEVGYDCDGVLLRQNGKRGIVPKGKFVVISGRMASMWKDTVEKIGLDAPIYLRPFGDPNSHIDAGHWKAHMVEYLGIKKFFEDNPVQAGIIRAKCPQCEVVMVNL